MKLAERVGSRRNNFNALRLIAASMVLVSHCFALTARTEPFAALSGQTLGALGVSVFFAISGFLIARSWDGDPLLRRFLVKRVLRLLPALIVAVLLTALVLGPLVSALPPSRYFTNSTVYRYIAENCVLDTINGRLPGVFVHNIYPGAVNGSLWTLPVESVAYICAAALGLLGAIRGRVGLAVASFGGLVLLSMPVISFGAISPSGLASGNLGLVLYLGAIFNAGVLLYVLRDRVPLRWDLAAALTAAWIASFNTQWVQTAAIVSVPYVVLVLAFRTPRRLDVITRPGDLSYGIYIYAFPAQQLAAHLWGRGLAPGVMLALVSMPVYALAYASWRLVEAPALRLKPTVARSSKPRAALA